MIQFSESKIKVQRSFKESERCQLGDKRQIKIKHKSKQADK